MPSAPLFYGTPGYLCPQVTASDNVDVHENLAENRLLILSNHFAIIPSRPVTKKKGIYVEAEERGPHPRSDRDGRIYRLAVPILKKPLNLVISRRSRAGTAKNKKA